MSMITVDCVHFAVDFAFEPKLKRQSAQWIDDGHWWITAANQGDQKSHAGQGNAHRLLWCAGAVDRSRCTNLQAWLWTATNIPALFDIICAQPSARNGLICCGRGRYLPYSPDLSQCDFFWFRRVKNELCGRRFVNVDEANEEFRCECVALATCDYSDGIDGLVKRSRKCVELEHHYYTQRQ